jgi:hypothetical protein
VGQRNKENKGFGYLRKTFSKIIEAKMKEGIFYGPQIKPLFQGQDFSKKINFTERRAWRAFVKVCINFLGN